MFEKMKFIDLFKVEYKSKYFGDIAFNADQFIDIIDVKYNDNDVSILVWDHIILEENKLKVCLWFIDKYNEIIQIVKNTIKYHLQNNIKIAGINDLQDIEIIVNKTYPDMFFDEYEINEIYVTLDYFDSKEHPEKSLSVEIDYDLIIKKMEYYTNIKQLGKLEHGKNIYKT